MERHLMESLLRFINEANVEELRAKKVELLAALERERIGHGTVRSDVMRVVRWIDEELLLRAGLAKRLSPRR
jgi:hypothetical protein